MMTLSGYQFSGCQDYCLERVVFFMLDLVVDLRHHLIFFSHNIAMAASASSHVRASDTEERDVAISM